MTRSSQAADPASSADPAPSACPGGDGAPAGDGGLAGDAVIIRRSWDEPEQFAVLFRLRAPEIQRYVTRRLGPDAAEDVVAETFLAAFRQRSGYDLTRGDARPWLYGIATNLIGHHRRSETRLLRALARTGHEPHTEPFTDRVDAEVSAGATGKLLAQALAKLPAPHRDTLLLVAWGDMTYEQAARALDVPVGTVRSRVSRARKSVRRALGDVDPSALPVDSTAEDSTAEERSDG
jgi:RNA polymerase sigma factor (sigma-70 family)